MKIEHLPHTFQGYIRDTGLLHALLDLGTARAIESHPKVGASWEGFALDAVTSQLGAEPEECFFWATHGGAELRCGAGARDGRHSAPPVISAEWALGSMGPRPSAGGDGIKRSKV